MKAGKTLLNRSVISKVSPPVPRRSGSLLLESVIALVVALTLLLGIAQWLALATQQRRALQQRTAAAHEAGNLMEELAALPWSELTAEKLGTVQLSPEFRQCLPDAALRVELTAEEEDAKRLQVAIDWSHSSGPRVAPVRLTAWRFRVAEDRP